MRFKKRPQKKSGFTLVELLVVIIIIGILAGGMMLVAGGGAEKANAARIVSDLRNLKAAAHMFYADQSRWPANMQELAGGGFMDRDMDAAEYDYRSSVGTPARDLVGYKGPLISNAGVQEKLKAAARDSGLRGRDGSSEYGGGAEVYMIVR